jgi:phospho-N-acetylmuramoyl-pentapeptide-transferase
LIYGFEDLLIPFWAAFIVSAIVAYPIFKVLLAMKSRQTISEFAPEGHQVKQGTPTMGGVIVVLGMLGGLLAANRTEAWGQHDYGPTWLGAATVLLAGFAAIGFIDDFVLPRVVKGSRGLGWRYKIVMQLAVAGLGAWLMWGHFGLLTWITVFVVLFYSNAYNFSDGLDSLAGLLAVGLAVGVIGIGFAALPDLTSMVLAASVIGAIIPFLYLNWPPAKIFMGDVGSLPIGAVFGAAMVALAYQFPAVGNQQLIPDHLGLLAAVKVLSVIMIIELVPVPLQIFWVKVFKKKLFFYTPIHHAFEKKGWPETRIVGMFFLAQLLLAALAVSIVASTNWLGPVSFAP